MKLDEAITKFAAYARGEGGFDELDLKEVIVDDREEAVREARHSELEMFKSIPIQAMSREVTSHISRRAAELTKREQE